MTAAGGKAAGAAALLALLAVQCGGEAGAARARGFADESISVVHGLGPLGATAHPATRQVVLPARGGGGEERHPGGVVLRELEPDGPLARGGLAPGDVLVQVGGECLPNLEDPTVALIAAVEAQVSAGGQPIEIGYVRGGELAIAALELDLIPLERGAPGPSERFDDAARRARDWLAAAQRPDGSWTAGGHAGDSGQPSVAATALAGCALVAGGPDAHGEALRRCTDFVREAMLGEPALAAEDAAFALMLVAELAAAPGSPELGAVLARSAERLLALQADDGGWLAAAATQDERDLATNQALCALGMAWRAGAAIPEKAFADACRYLKQGANDGYVGFARREGFDRRSEAGRCAGAAAALLAAGCRHDDAFVARLIDAQEALGADLARAPRGASLGVFNAAVLARQRGGPAWARFVGEFRHLLVAVQQRDGSCRWLPRPHSEPLPFEGTTFDTACVALVLALQRDRVAVLLARHRADELGQRDSDGALAPRAPGADDPAGAPALPPGAQVLRVEPGEDLREQLEKLGLPAEQIEEIEKQVPKKGEKQ